MIILKILLAIIGINFICIIISEVDDFISKIIDKINNL